MKEEIYVPRGCTVLNIMEDKTVIYTDNMIKTTFNDFARDGKYTLFLQGADGKTRVEYADILKNDYCFHSHMFLLWRNNGVWKIINLYRNGEREYCIDGVDFEKYDTVLMSSYFIMCKKNGNSYLFDHHGKRVDRHFLHHNCRFINDSDDALVDDYLSGWMHIVSMARDKYIHSFPRFREVVGMKILKSIDFNEVTFDDYILKFYDDRPCISNRFSGPEEGKEFVCQNEGSRVLYNQESGTYLFHTRNDVYVSEEDRLKLIKPYLRYKLEKDDEGCYRWNKIVYE
jgi:hypothetical protein